MCHLKQGSFQKTLQRLAQPSVRTNLTSVKLPFLSGKAVREFFRGWQLGVHMNFGLHQLRDAYVLPCWLEPDHVLRWPVRSHMEASVPTVRARQASLNEQDPQRKLPQRPPALGACILGEGGLLRLQFVECGITLKPSIGRQDPWQRARPPKLQSFRKLAKHFLFGAHISDWGHQKEGLRPLGAPTAGSEKVWQGSS